MHNAGADLGFLKGGGVSGTLGLLNQIGQLPPTILQKLFEKIFWDIIENDPTKIKLAIPQSRNYTEVHNLFQPL